MNGKNQNPPKHFLKPNYIGNTDIISTCHKDAFGRDKIAKKRSIRTAILSDKSILTYRHMSRLNMWIKPLQASPQVGKLILIIITQKRKYIIKVEIDNLIPDVTNGKDGVDGKDGADGQDGFSPVAAVSKEGNTATITITDKNGTTTATVSDGKDGTSGGSSGGSGEVYSTEEMEVGTWIDGKTIYQRVFDLSDITP